MSLLMCVCFMAAWTPYTVVSFLYLCHAAHNVPMVIVVAAPFFAKGSTCCNPVTYFLMIKRFREDTRALFRRLCLSGRTQWIKVRTSSDSTPGNSIVISNRRATMIKKQETEEEGKFEEEIELADRKYITPVKLIQKGEDQQQVILDLVAGLKTNNKKRQILISALIYALVTDLQTEQQDTEQEESTTAVNQHILTSLAQLVSMKP